IGKDITRFHCLIWPAMLMAAGVELPKSIFGHGFVYNRGEKMSKTLGNIVDPINLANYFGADALRYLLLREIAFDRDGDFTVELFVTRYNAELANELGNLFSRTLSMTQRYFEGAVPAYTPEGAKEAERLTRTVAQDYRREMDALAFDRALAAVWRAVQEGNRFVEERKPWAQAKNEREALGDTLRALLEVLRMCSILVQPFMPEKALAMRAQLGLSAGFTLDEAGRFGDGAWKRIGTSAVLFPRIEIDAKKAS
ncbi:MAG TPA: class I tRNA ligase family protein, partial [Candidatus Krumholzibacteria bacterium]|nr:class I tRNA ligase family protein [Candidatus Krumholzibacteria bacterium]